MAVVAKRRSASAMAPTLATSNSATQPRSAASTLALSPRRRPPQTHAAAAALAYRALVDQLDTGAVQRGDQLHQRLDVAADHAVARLHALDGGQREARRFGERCLVEARKGPRGAQLARGDHLNCN